MRLLIDECLPRALKRRFPEHEFRTVQEMGWSAKKNGVLLALADGKFDVLLTIDQNLEYQQDLANRQIAMLVISALSNQIEDLEPVVPHVLTALRNIRPGRVVRVGI